MCRSHAACHRNQPGDKGVAVSLLNYGEESNHAAVQTIEISVIVDKPVTCVESAQQGTLEFKQRDQKVAISLPFADVNVVKLYY
jgi:hypothetical protein